jgi:hypothetical protein
VPKQSLLFLSAIGQSAFNPGLQAGQLSTQGLPFHSGGGQILFDLGAQIIQLPQQALLLLTREGQSALDFGLQTGQLPEQTFAFLACAGQLLFDFSGGRVNARLESLYQVLPEMLEHGHRNDLRGSNAAVIIESSLLLSFRVAL